MVVFFLLAPPEYSKYSNPNDEPNGKDKNKTNCNLDGPYPGKQYLHPDVANYPGNENQGTQGQPLMTTGVLCSIKLKSIITKHYLVNSVVLFGFGPTLKSIFILSF